METKPNAAGHIENDSDFTSVDSLPRLFIQKIRQTEDKNTDRKPNNTIKSKKQMYKSGEIICIYFKFFY